MDHPVEMISVFSEPVGKGVKVVLFPSVELKDRATDGQPTDDGFGHLHFPSKTGKDKLSAFSCCEFGRGVGDASLGVYSGYQDLLSVEHSH